MRVFMFLILWFSGRYWLSVGAQPSDTVRHIFSLAGLLPKPPVPQMSKKGDGLAGILEEEEAIDADEEEEEEEEEEEDGWPWTARWRIWVAGIMKETWG